MPQRVILALAAAALATTLLSACGSSAADAECRRTFEATLDRYEEMAVETVSGLIAAVQGYSRPEFGTSIGTTFTRWGVYPGERNIGISMGANWATDVGPYVLRDVSEAYLVSTGWVPTVSRPDRLEATRDGITIVLTFTASYAEWETRSDEIECPDDVAEEIYDSDSDFRPDIGLEEPTPPATTPPPATPLP